MDPRPLPAQLVVELQSRPASSLPGGSESRLNPVPVSQLPSAQTVAATPLQQTGGSNSSVSAPGFVQQSPASKASNPFSAPHPNLPPPKQQPLNSGTHSSDPGNPAPLPAGDDDGNTRHFAQSVVSSGGGRAVLAGSGSGGSSPSKEQRRAPSPAATTTKTSPSATPVPHLNRLAPSLPAENTGSMTSSSSTALPHLTPAQSRDARSDHALDSSPLPPPSGGLSPTKHSPPVPKPQNPVNGSGTNGTVTVPIVGGVAQTPVVFPPVAALSPSPRQQILTPPVKPAEPARVVPAPQQLAQGSQTAQAVSSGSPRPDAPSS